MRSDSLLVFIASLIFVHWHLTTHAVSIFAQLANEYVAICLWREEATPVALCHRARTIIFTALIPGLCSFVQPPESVRIAHNLER